MAYLLLLLSLFIHFVYCINYGICNGSALPPSCYTGRYLYSKSFTNNLYDKQLIDELVNMLGWQNRCPLVGGQVMLNSTVSHNVFKKGLPVYCHFTLNDLAPRQGAGVSIALIDTGLYSPFPAERMYIDQHQIDLIPDQRFSSHMPLAQHGNHLYSLIKGSTDLSFKGIALAAEVTMVRAFSSDGTTTISTLTQALKHSAIYKKADIVCLGIKVDNGARGSFAHGAYKEFEEALLSFTWPIVAAGNDDTYGMPWYASRQIAYPACLPLPVISIGAYGYYKNSLYVPSFSQGCPESAPLFLAPGVSIAGRVFIQAEKESSAYLFMDGTSVATALFVGFLALVLGEFKEDFLSSEIFMVLVKSSYQSSCLSLKSVYGIVDMRRALFVLHVLKLLKTCFSFYYSCYSFNYFLLSIISWLECHEHDAHDSLFSYVYSCALNCCLDLPMFIF